MDKVLIKIISWQKDISGEKNRIDLTTIGKHYYKNSMHYVLYEEAVEGSKDTVHTMLKISDAAMTLVRRGPIKQEQYFALEESSESNYITPYGNLLLAVYPHKLMINYGAIAGTIAIDYDLSMNGQLQSHNKLRIKISADSDAAV